MMSKSFAAILRATALAGFLAAQIQGQFVAGQVVDDQGQGIAGVALTFTQGVTPAGAISGLGGFFNVAVPADTYDIGFDPPNNFLAPKMLLSVEVIGATNLGVIALETGFILTGTVQDFAGMPVSGGNIDVFDRQSGDLMFTTGDGTNIFGVFDFVVPAGTFRVRAKPPGGVLLVTRDVEPVVVTGPTVVPTITLPKGFLVTGRVIDAQTLLPLAGVDLDADDSRTGKRLVTPGDNTDANGLFRIVLPSGRFDISLDPPRGSRHVGRKFLDLIISSARDFGTITMREGLLLSGTIVGPGSVPVFRSDIDLLSVPGGESLPISNDNTDGDGNFTIAMLPGRYRIRAEPRVSDRLLSAVTLAIDVVSDLTIPTMTLSSGVLFSGKIQAFDGQPEAGTDIDLIDPATGVEVLLSHDNTNAAGNYALVAPPGIWNIRFQTKKLSPSRTQILVEREIFSDTVINRRLSVVPVFVYLSKPAAVTVAFQGGFMPLIVGIANLSKGIVGSEVSMLLIDPTGIETSLFPPTFLFIPSEDDGPANPRSISESIELRLFIIAVPSVNPSHLGQTFRFKLRLDDPETGEEFDQDSIKVIIQ